MFLGISIVFNVARERAEQTTVLEVPLEKWCFILVQSSYRLIVLSSMYYLSFIFCVRESFISAGNTPIARGSSCALLLFSFVVVENLFALNPIYLAVDEADE